MPLIGLFLVIICFLIIIWLMGSLFLVILKDHEENALFLGFFIYFSLFQALAFPMILSLRPLSWLTYSWLFVIVCICIAAVCYRRLLKERLKRLMDACKCRDIFTFSGILMIGLALAQLYYALMNPTNGWDTAHYVPNVVKSIATNSMHIYQGSTGLLEETIDLRHALSSFYMHDAVIGQISGIHGAIVCKWFNVIICHLLSVVTVYKVGTLIFKKKESVQAMVCFWVIANFGAYTIYMPNAFFMGRGLEAKAYCCNIVIPAVIYIFLKIYQEPEIRKNWIELFIINLSSIAISASSILVVPFINGCLFIGHLMIEKRIRNIKKMIVCLLPNTFYLLLYLLYQLGYFTVVIPR
ncbi:MAG: hypothetical protein HDR00_15730 [Lachnospiraceae bacterium]|nr:hypothetical protein [Lachnospiraceae bacterium]